MTLGTIGGAAPKYCDALSSFKEVRLLPKVGLSTKNPR